MAKKIKDPGFGYTSNKNLKEVINRDGSSNVLHLNRKFKISDLYVYCIDLSWGKFFLFIMLNYTLLNIFFGLLYVFIGIEQITVASGSFIKDFLNAFFFSAQTLTTVGYGGISPIGITANFIAAFEALLGLLSFSFITGLLYGRFSKAKAALLFSDNIIIRNFKDHKALMFRLMNGRKTIMIEPEIRVTLSVNEKNEEGGYSRNYFNIKLESDKIMYLPTTWTLVHEIDETSPLYKYSDEELKALDAELYILVQYHEESYAQKVYQVISYDFSQLQLDVKYIRSYDFDTEGYTVLDHQKLSEVESMHS